VPVDPDLAPGVPATANIHPDWTFEIRGVTGPRRLQLVRFPSGWALKEVMIGGVDVTDRPVALGSQDLTDVEVVLTNRISEVSGLITDDGGRPAPASNIVIFPSDHDRWYWASRFLRKAVSGTDGMFSVPGLPAGGYYMAVVQQLPADGDDGWEDPDFLQSLIPRAISLTLRDAEKLGVNFRLPSP
jgi:hypothetical protein